MNSKVKNDDQVASDAVMDAPVNPFALQEVFVDTRALFDDPYKTLIEISKSGFVALDANVLLMPYEMDSVSLPQVISVYRALATEKRLIVPAQAAREFAKHRSAKIISIVQHLRTQMGKEAPLPKKIGILLEHTAYIEAKRKADQIATITKELRKDVEVLIRSLASQIGNDPVSNAYRGLLGGCIREDSVSKKDEPEFLKTLQDRYNNKRPPGYKDKQKSDAGAGDLLIWMSLLEEGKLSSRDCIFVTADEKSDWYYQLDGAFQPRLELIEEYRSFTGGRTLHVIPLSAMLTTFEAQAEAVADAKRVEEERLADAMVKDRDDETLRRHTDNEFLVYKRALQEKLKATELDLAQMHSHLGDLPMDYNESLSLPWNRAKLPLRRMIVDATARRDDLRKQLDAFEI